MIFFKKNVIISTSRLQLPLPPPPLLFLGVVPSHLDNLHIANLFNDSVCSNVNIQQLATIIQAVMLSEELLDAGDLDSEAVFIQPCHPQEGILSYTAKKSTEVRGSESKRFTRC